MYADVGGGAEDSALYPNEEVALFIIDGEGVLVCRGRDRLPECEVSHWLNIAGGEFIKGLRMPSLWVRGLRNREDGTA